MYALDDQSDRRSTNPREWLVSLRPVLERRDDEAFLPAYPPKLARRSAVRLPCRCPEPQGDKQGPHLDPQEYSSTGSGSPVTTVILRESERLALVAASLSRGVSPLKVSAVRGSLAQVLENFHLENALLSFVLHASYLGGIGM